MRLKKAIESQLFDIMAHPDVVRKYSVQYSNIPFERYRDQVEAVRLSEQGYDYGIRAFGVENFKKDVLSPGEILHYGRYIG